MELYYTPLACSFAARVVAHEARIPLALHPVDLRTRTLADTGASYLDVSPLGLVPALRLDDGAVLTEVAAVVQYLADQRPEAGLAPPWGTRDRYRLVEWLAFVSTELHKKVLWPIFNPVPDAARAHAREAAARVLDHVAHHLAARAHVVGERFTAADAYLFWALHLARIAGLTGDRPALAAYLHRLRARPSIAELLADETPRARAAVSPRG